jgi:hypothetical protein
LNGYPVFHHVKFTLFIYSTAFGDTFAEIGVREPQPRASEVFRQFGDYHRQMEKYGIKMLKSVKPVSTH